MSYANSKYVVLYQKNWSEALRTAKRLQIYKIVLGTNYFVTC